MKIKEIIIIVLIVAVVAVGGYFAYAKYFIKNQQGVKSDNVNQTTVVTTNGPKATYMEAIGKLQQAKTLDEAIDITSAYTYFATPAEKETAVTATQSQIKVLTDVQKTDLLQAMKDLYKFSSTADIKEIINGNSATLDITNSDGSKSTMNMVIDGNVWKITQ